MATFLVKYQTRQGVKASEVVAKTDAEARRMMERRGRVISVRKQFKLKFSVPLADADRQIFLARLSAMLYSRVGASEAFGLIRDTFHGKISEVAGLLHTNIEAGDDISEAIGRLGPPDFPATTVALIQAGSRGGETWRALQDAATFEQEMGQVKKSAGKGIWGGIIGFLFAGITTVASTVYLGPKVMSSDMMKASASSVNIGWVNTFGNVMGAIMGVIMVIGILLLLLAAVGRRIMPVQADRLILKIPYYKDLILARNNYTVLYGLALLVKSGVRLEEALRLSMEGAPKGALRNDLARAMNAVKEGKPWAKDMETLHPTDKAALMSSMDREQISRTLNALARQYKELYAQRLGSFVPTMNMLTALFLSLAGFVLFGETILPMLQATNGTLH